MERLLIIVVSWNRPHFLRRTLESLFKQFVDTPHDVAVVDNASDAETVTVLRNESRLAHCCLLEANRGLNIAIEAALDAALRDAHRWILISDADMEYLQSVQDGLDLLDAHPQIGAVSLQHSPEHEAEDQLVWKGRVWPLKRCERGCSMLFRKETLQRMRPLPVAKLLDFDWWVCRDAPQSLQARGEPIAVLVGGARHLGWRSGDSTWQTAEVPEFAEFRV